MEGIEDLIVISRLENANIELLLEAAFKRGIVVGKNLAKERIIEAIEQEK